ncbi:MAG: hypothetical protein IPN34_24215 [Planctomycetes bacterium]|nr:hypothetical protein [Planctomycetota bacterium]
MSASLPICHAILICDVVYIDLLSERVYLLGLLDESSSRRVLGRRVAFSVFCELAGGCGHGKLRLELCHVHRETLERERIAEAVVEVDYTSTSRSLAASLEARNSCPGPRAAADLREAAAHSAAIFLDALYAELRKLARESIPC